MKYSEIKMKCGLVADLYQHGSGFFSYQIKHDDGDITSGTCRSVHEMLNDINDYDNFLIKKDGDK